MLHQEEISVMYIPAEHCENASKPILVTLLGIIILFKLSQSPKAYLPMLVTPSRISTEYLYFAVKDVKIGKGYARHYSFLKSSLIIVPSQELALDFQEQVGKLFNQITLNRKQILSLTKLRDELLPLLMNGQVNFDLSAY